MKFLAIAVVAVLGWSICESNAATVIPLIDLGGRAGFHINGQETDDWLGFNKKWPQTTRLRAHVMP